MYRDEEIALKKIPTLAMISAPVADVNRRAKRLRRRLGKSLAGQCRISIIDTDSRVGGGAMPEQNLASRALALNPLNIEVNELERRLRGGTTPIICRIEDDSLILDMRTVADDEVAIVTQALLTVFQDDLEVR
jgi:L-seryl-tRNA(Ser) seleniumtransferase